MPSCTSRSEPAAVNLVPIPVVRRSLGLSLLLFQLRRRQPFFAPRNAPLGFIHPLDEDAGAVGDVADCGAVVGRQVKDMVLLESRHALGDAVPLGARDALLNINQVGDPQTVTDVDGVLLAFRGQD